MANGKVIGLVIGLIVLAVLIFVSPFLACLYRGHQFESLVRLMVDSPDCQKTIPGQRAECCQCYIAFDGVRNADAIEFSGAGLRHTYNGENRIFLVSGDGEVRNGRNSIELRSGHIYVDGELVSGRSTPVRVLVKGDGHLLNEFCDVSW